MFKGKPGHLLRRGKPADHEIKIAEPQLLQKDGIFAGDDLQSALGFFLQKQADRLRHDAGRNGGQRTDPDWHALPRLLIGDRIDALPQCGDGRAGIAQEHLAIARDPDSAPVPLENGDAQAPLPFHG